MVFELVSKNMPDEVSNYAAKLKCFSPNARFYLLFVFFITLNVGIYGVIFNLYILSLGFGEDFLGLILSISSASVGIFAIPAAFVCDRLGRKRTLLLSSLLLSVSLIFLYNSTSEWLLIAFSIAYGGASTLGLVTGATFLVENSTPYERMHLFSMYSIIYAMSTLAGNMVGGYFPDFVAGLTANLLDLEVCRSTEYRLTLYLSLASVIFSLIPIAHIKEMNATEGCSYSITGQLHLYRSTFKLQTVRRMLLFYCLLGAGWGTALPYFNVFLDVVHKASPTQIGLIFSAAQLLMMVGYFLVPVLTERYGKIKLASMLQALSIPFLLIFTFSSSLLVAAFGYVMRYLLMNMANPIVNSFKLEIAEAKERSIINSSMWMACYTFVGIGTYAGGLMIADGRPEMPFLATSVIYLASAIVYFIFFNNIERLQNK
jgi:MFS family permease